MRTIIWEENLERLVITVSELCEILSIGRSHAYDMVREGRIGSVRAGNKILIPRAEIARFLATGVQTTGKADGVDQT